MKTPLLPLSKSKANHELHGSLIEACNSRGRLTTDDCSIPYGGSQLHPLTSPTVQNRLRRDEKLLSVILDEAVHEEGEKSRTAVSVVRETIRAHLRDYAAAIASNQDAQATTSAKAVYKILGTISPDFSTDRFYKLTKGDRGFLEGAAEHKDYRARLIIEGLWADEGLVDSRTRAGMAREDPRSNLPFGVKAVHMLQDIGTLVNQDLKAQLRRQGCKDQEKTITRLVLLAGAIGETAIEATPALAQIVADKSKSDPDLAKLASQVIVNIRKVNEEAHEILVAAAKERDTAPNSPNIARALLAKLPPRPPVKSFASSNPIHALTE